MLYPVSKNKNNMSLLNNKQNCQSSISSGTFVGLRAETSHVNELHADKLFSDEGLDVYTELKALREELNELKERTLQLSSLTDVNVSELTEGSVLVWSSGQQKWVAQELENEV